MVFKSILKKPKKPVTFPKKCPLIAKLATGE